MSERESMSLNQRSKGRKDKQTDVEGEEVRWRPGESGWREGVTGREKKRNRKKKDYS